MWKNEELDKISNLKSQELFGPVIWFIKDNKIL